MAAFNPLEILGNLPVLGTGTKAIVKTAETTGMLRGLKRGFIAGTVVTGAVTAVSAAAVLLLHRRNEAAEKAGKVAAKTGKTAVKAAKAAVGAVRAETEAANGGKAEQKAE